ncbi:MAG: prolyl-tRNA synthetase associated domain-containing protein, partial [Pseudomonadota bacterium]
VLNDGGRRATMVLDRGTLDQGPVNVHPLRNDMTTAVSPEGLLRFLEAEGHPPDIIDFGAPL